MNIRFFHIFLSFLALSSSCKAMESIPLLEKTRMPRVGNAIESLDNVNEHLFACLKNLATGRPFYIPRCFLLNVEKKLPRYVCLHAQAELLLLEVLVGLKACPERNEKLVEYYKTKSESVLKKASLLDKIYFLEAVNGLSFPKEFQQATVIFIIASEKIDSKEILDEDTVSHCVEVFRKVAEARTVNTVKKVVNKKPAVRIGVKVKVGNAVIAQTDPVMGSLADLPNTLLVLLCWEDRESDTEATSQVIFPVYKKFLPKSFVNHRKHAFDVPVRAAKKRGYLLVTTPKYNPMLFDSFIPLLYQYSFCSQNKSIAWSAIQRCHPALLDALQHIAFVSARPNGSVEDNGAFTELTNEFSSLLDEFQIRDLGAIVLKAASEVRVLFSVAPESIECLKACVKRRAAKLTDIIFDDTDLRFECAGPIADLLISYNSLHPMPVAAGKLLKGSINLGIILGLEDLNDFIIPLTEYTRLPLFDRNAKLEHEGSMKSCELLSMQKPEAFPYEAFINLCRHLAKKYDRTLLETLNQQLARENYRSVADIDVEFLQRITPPGSAKVAVPSSSVIDQFAAYLKKQLEPDFEFRRRTALAFLQVNKPFLFQDEVLDQRSWMDLELVCGQKAHAAEYVMTCVPTFTQIGHVVMMQRAVNVTSNVEKLKKTQSRIQCLGKHARFKELCDALTQLKEAETGVFSFWDNGDWIERQFNELMLNFGGLDRKFTCVKKFCDWWNSHTAMLELSDRWKQVGTIIATPVGVAGAVMATIFAPGTGALTSKAVTGAMNGTSLAKSVPELIAHFGDSISYLACFRICLHLKLVHLANYFQALDKVRDVIKGINQNGLFDEYLQGLAYEEFPHIHSLRDLLVKKTFKNGACFPKTFVEMTAIFGFCTGRILNAFNIVRNHKNELLPAISALAEIDILASSAKLLNESEIQRENFESNQLIIERKMLRGAVRIMERDGKSAAEMLERLRELDKSIKREQIKEPNLYCLPEFLDAAEPYIDVEGSWNPLLRAPLIITNDLVVGDVKHPRNVVINGPNAGGKSSIMKGIIIAIVMAQSIGIAPASCLKFTPFERIRAYLNITDDQAGGNSLFMSAVNRAFDVYQDVKKLREHNEQAFSLTVFDELFNGTSSLEGEAAARTLIEFIGREPHNLNLITTHFKSLMTLADEAPDTFVNYKVTVDDQGKKLCYPFKLEKGVSDQCIAFQVLAQKGFNAEFIARCSQIVEQLKSRK